MKIRELSLGFFVLYIFSSVGIYAQSDELNFKVSHADQGIVDSNLQDSIFYRMEDAMKDPLRVSQLLIESKNLASLPKDVLHFKHLKVLDISHNRIHDLPDSLFIFCSFLTEIRYAGNELKTIPSVLFHHSLRVLDLSENHLTQLDARLSKCLRLEELDLHANDINTLPSSSMVLTNLKSLILSENPIKQIGAWMFNQPQLKILFLENTQLETVPFLMCQVNQLKLLNIEGNELATLPDCICQMKSLKVMMMMEGNHFKPSLMNDLSNCLPDLKIR